MRVRIKESGEIVMIADGSFNPAAHEQVLDNGETATYRGPASREVEHVEVETPAEEASKKERKRKPRVTTEVLPEHKEIRSKTKRDGESAGN